jgi:hypothetical protein
MWAESESRLEDLARVTLLVHSQVRLSLEDEAGKTWLNLEKDLLESEYSVIRDRQMQMLEKEDGMMGRKAVRELREKLGGEAYEVMSEQRWVQSWGSGSNISEFPRRAGTLLTKTGSGVCSRALGSMRQT